MLSASLDGRLWHIDGESGLGDSIVIEVNPEESTRLRAVVNGTSIGSVEIDAIDTIYISGGRGDDRILVKLAEANERIRLRIDGGRGDDTLLGGAGRDELRGGRGDDLLDGGAGADVLRGDGGNDDLAAGDGADLLRGDEGADTLSGGWGRDLLSGGTGNDQLRGGADGDFLYGNAGRDVLRGGDGRDRLMGGPDHDRLYRESARDQVTGSLGEIHTSPDDTGAVIRMTDRDTWADQIIQAGLRIHHQQFGMFGGTFLFDGIGFGAPSMVVNTAEGAMRLAAADAETFAANNVTGEADQSFSTTNTQVDGVDEADIVETDGRYIYSITSGKLVITNVQDARAMRVASTTSLGDGGALGMYLDGSKLTVISTVFESDGTTPPQPISGQYFFTDDYRSGKQRTQVTTFDVSDSAAPAKLATTTLDGWYQSSRLIDGRLYVVVNNGMAGVYPQSIEDNGQWRTETESEYTARVRDDVLGFSPQATVTRDGRSVDRDLIDPTNVYMSSDPRIEADITQLTTVTMIDTANPSAGPVSSATFAGTGGTTYASNDALYLVNNGWGDTPSKVVKFGLASTSVTVEATGVFDGQINNQFSLDQDGDHLRVAYTRGGGFDSSNGILVFDQVGDELDAIGELGGLATGESIFSARFIGDEAYLVTFRQVDPLFTIDLSDPTRPRLLGELEIPGFSRYLHPLDENHLIGFGRNADENGVTQGLQLSIFDVTDRAHPRRVDALELNTDGWSYSTAEWDHLAFQFNAEAGVILLPVATESGSRLELIRVDASAGLERIGAVNGDEAGIARGVWIGGNVFAVGGESIHSADINTAASRGVVQFA